MYEVFLPINQSKKVTSISDSGDILLALDIEEWLSENIKNTYKRATWTSNHRMDAIIFLFEDESDAMAFKLKWL